MSFLVLPPEMNSALMHAGAGSSPMLAAAAAWDGLASELGSAAQSFSSVTSGLAGDAWQGAASAAMLSTAAQYSGVLSAAATQAQTAAAQAQTVASEFEAALAATVHPALVSANRNQLVQLVMSNLFGQNAPAIAATEFDYEAMWAQDVAAMIGYHGGVSAAAAQLSTFAAALPGLSGVPAAIASGGVGSALSSLNPAAVGPLGLLGLNSGTGGVLAGLPGPVGDVFGTARRLAVDVVNAPTSLLFGQNLIPSGPQPTGGTATIINGSTAVAPLTVRGGTEPIVDAKVGPGGPEPLLVDTGSRGLIIPFTDVGGLVGLLQLGVPQGINVGGFSGGLDYLYLNYNAPVNFGGGLVTSPTPVQVELLAWPTSLQSLQSNGLTFQSFFASDGAAGVLGVGPNAGGPGPSVPTSALPAPFNQGLLIDQPAHQLVFEPQSNVGLTPLATLTGSPITTLGVQVNGGAIQPVSSIVDSGGVDGSLPTSLNAPKGALIQVFAPGVATPLYQFTNGVNYSPIPITSGLMNTGNLIFQFHPVYINYGANTSTIY
jgi:PPE family